MFNGLGKTILLSYVLTAIVGAIGGYALIRLAVWLWNHVQVV